MAWNRWWFGGFNEGGIVPVELVSFTIKFSPKDMFVKLEWQTVTETDNFGFEIERTISKEWNKVGFVKGNGTTTIPQQYNFSENINNLIQQLQNPSITLKYRLKQIDFAGNIEYSPEVEVTLDQKPLTFKLCQNYPNPFNPETEIAYKIPVAQHVSLAIYDINSRLVRTLVDERKDAGYYTVHWNGKDNHGHAAPSGVYLYHLQSERFTKTGKAALIK